MIFSKHARIFRKPAQFRKQFFLMFQTEVFPNGTANGQMLRGTEHAYAVFFRASGKVSSPDDKQRIICRVLGPRGWCARRSSDETCPDPSAKNAGRVTPRVDLRDP